MSVASTPRGAFVLSLDLPQTATHDVVTRLAKPIRAHHVAASWTVPVGANLGQLADVLGPTSGQPGVSGELAWSSQPVWAGANVGRGKFAVALAERASAALEAGVEISTLVLTAGCAATHLDVAAKYGIRSVVTLAPVRVRSPQPHALRYGVWNVPATVSMSSAGSWWTNQARRAIHEINRAARYGTVCHVHADLARAEAVAALDGVLAHVQRCRVEGRLTVETVGQLVARLARPRTAGRAAHSILRAA